MYWGDQQLSSPQIAEALNTNHHLIQRVMRRNNIKLRTPSEGVRVRRISNEDRGSEGQGSGFCIFDFLSISYNEMINF